MIEEITGLPEAVSSIVNKLVENAGAPFPFLVAAVGLNGAIWYRRVELLEAERGQCRTIPEKLVEGGFTFPINIMVVDGAGKGYLAVIGAGDSVDSTGAPRRVGGERRAGGYRCGGSPLRHRAIERHGMPGTERDTPRPADRRSVPYPAWPCPARRRPAVVDGQARVAGVLDLEELTLSVEPDGGLRRAGERCDRPVLEQNRLSHQLAPCSCASRPARSRKAMRRAVSSAETSLVSIGPPSLPVSSCAFKSGKSFAARMAAARIRSSKVG